MKIIEFIKKELTGWKKHEITMLIFAFGLIIFNTIMLHDSMVAVCSAFFGILYTVLAGKGKVSCYFFGLLGSGCYIYLSFTNQLWGNALLYMAYYVPMQVYGISSWLRHLDESTNTIVKSKLSQKDRLLYVLIAILGCIASIVILKYFNDSSPLIDGVTTFLSIIGMYLTVRRLVEQWIVWIIVNGLSFIMWTILIMHGVKAYSTLVMWWFYFILAIYFYIVWIKEMKQKTVSKLHN